MASRAAVAAIAGLLAAAAHADDALWKALGSTPNLVVLMRHAQSAPGADPLKWDETGNCKGESMLTAAGREHARRIGEAFKRRGVQPTVISSPMCRCRDTARLAFGDPVVLDPELREVATADSRRMQAYERRAQSLFVAHRGAMPIVFVSHRPNVDRLTMELIDEGELLVAKANEAGDVEVIGRMRID